MYSEFSSIFVFQTNIFIVNLAFSDLCMMTSMGFPVVINAFASDIWMWGALACRIYGCLGGIFGTVSIVTLVVIGYDRYNVIVCGFNGVKITYTKAIVVIILVWTYGILGCCPPFWGWGGYALGTNHFLLTIDNQLKTFQFFQRDCFLHAAMISSLRIGIINPM